MPTNENTNIRSILVANRGEVASRIFRTCRKMGIHCIAVYSISDRDLPYLSGADEAINIGDGPPSMNYLDQDKIIAAAKSCGADAIHPGYGFLAENHEFAQRCIDQGIIFIGPRPEVIRSMGSKSEAKKLMLSAGVPVIPGYEGTDQSAERLIEEVSKVGLPVMIKASAGGGGRGMRKVATLEHVESAIISARREAEQSFGDGHLLVERYIKAGRHIEFQIMGDHHGNVIHLFERECTIQRRHQKIIEESPSPILTEELRKKMARAAITAAKALHFDNMGTVEFLLDEENNEFYFLEINTRLQVEHPVTEAITGLDLVQMQIEAAQGNQLQIDQKDIPLNGYALECRLYAEDPARSFAPVTGIISQFKYPEIEGLRVENTVVSGSQIAIYYDPMIAKLIVHGMDRASAIRKASYVLSRLVCLGITTNQRFLYKVLSDENFIRGHYNLNYAGQAASKFAESQVPELHYGWACMAVTLYNWHQRQKNRRLLKHLPSGWRNNHYKDQEVVYSAGGKEFVVQYRYYDGQFSMKIGNLEYEVHLLSCDTNHAHLEISGKRKNFHIAQNEDAYWIHHPKTGPLFLKCLPRFPEGKSEEVPGQYTTTMPARVVKVLVKEGQKVSKGASLVVLSSMKMENTMHAAEDGIVVTVYVEPNDHVDAGFLLLKLEASNSEKIIPQS